MMEDGYYPTFEKTHIIFEVEDNLGVIEYDDCILSIRLFFTIDEDSYDLFLEASNITMQESYAVKAVVLDDMKNIMFSCEFPCYTEREFRKFLPKGIELLKNALDIHKEEMRKAILAESIINETLPTTDDSFGQVSSSGRKMMS